MIVTPLQAADSLRVGDEVPVTDHLKSRAVDQMGHLSFLPADCAFKVAGLIGEHQVQLTIGADEECQVTVTTLEAGRAVAGSREPHMPLRF